MSNLEMSQLLGNYGELVGAIAIVITLIYLTKQLKQNTDSIRATAYQNWVAANVQINAAFSDPNLGPAILKGNRNSTDLTEETAAAYGMLHLSMFQMAQSLDYLFRSGAVDQELWEAEMDRIAGILSTRGVRQLWDAGFKTQLAPSFVSRLESAKSKISYVDWDETRGWHRNEKILQTEE